MPQRPIRFGIQKHIEIGLLPAQKLLCLKAVKPQKPVRLIEPVLPKQGRASRKDRQVLILINADKGGVIHSL